MLRQNAFLQCVVLSTACLSLSLDAVAGAAAPSAAFYIAPDGNDDNPGSQAKPFATLARAQKAVRNINKKTAGDIEIILRGGLYPIGETIVFGPDDSGTNGHQVIYRAAPNETPLISGGKTVSDWTLDEKGRWKAPAPVAAFRQMYVEGVRAVRARGKAPADLERSGDDGYTTTTVDMAKWKNTDALEFCYLVIWAHTRCKVKEIAAHGDRAIISMAQPYFSQAAAKEGVNIANPDQVDSIYLENALELLDEPGEWYFDPKAKTVYYMPRPGEDMRKAEVVVPALETLVALRGTLDQPVQNIRFEGITFAYGNWLLPSKIGLVDVQANFVLNPKTLLKRDTGLTAVHNELQKSPSNVVCHAARSIRFHRCTFTKLGGGGIDLEHGSQDNVISGCHFFDISGTAIQIGDVLKDDHHPDDPRKIVKNNSVTNNYIHDCGVEYWGSVGVFAGYTEGTVIAHNEIADLPYSGVSVGWGWGEEDAGGGAPNYQQPFRYDSPTPAKNNRIEFNHIHRAMGKTDDGAGIYTLGNQPGTVIRGNYVHDCKNPSSRRGWSQGIYLDEGSGFIEVANNLVRNLHPIHFNNKVQDRIATCNVHDNSFTVKDGKVDANAADAMQKPTDAWQRVIDNAGLEPSYRDLLDQTR